METESTLVRSDRSIELNAPAAIDLHLFVVVFPGHAERDNAVRLRNAFQNAGLPVLRMFLDEREERAKDFSDRLMKLFFVRVSVTQRCHKLRVKTFD